MAYRNFEKNEEVKRDREVYGSRLQWKDTLFNIYVLYMNSSSMNRHLTLSPASLQSPAINRF